MKEIKNKVIKMFEYKDYYIYIMEDKIEKGTYYGCYLQNKQYGIISLMFGLPKDKMVLGKYTLRPLIEVIENHLEEYIEMYKKDYEDEV